MKKEKPEKKVKDMTKSDKTITITNEKVRKRSIKKKSNKLNGHKKARQ